MSNEFEKIFDNIAASAVPEPQDYTDTETGLLFCGKCHTHKQCRVTLFGKDTYRVHIHFSTTSTETMSDKIKRMLKNEIQQM